MLRKLKVAGLVMLGLQVARGFGLELEAPENFGVMVETALNSLYAVIPVVAGWFTRENAGAVARLKLK